MNNIKDLIINNTTKLKNTIHELKEENDQLKKQIKETEDLINENRRLKQQIKEYDEITNFITDYFNKLDIDSPKVTSIVPVFKWTPSTGNAMLIPDIDEKSKDLKCKNKEIKLISKSKNYFDKRRHNRINKNVPNNSESDSEKYTDTDTKKIDNIKKLFDSDFKFFFPKK